MLVDDRDRSEALMRDSRQQTSADRIQVIQAANTLGVIRVIRGHLVR